MAKPKKKTKTVRHDQPKVALYRLDADTQRGDAVRVALKDAGLLVKTINPENLNDTVGSLAGMVSMKPSLKPYDGDVPEVEFMLFCNVPKKTLDAVLATLRTDELYLGLKAVVTTTNRLWPVATLIEQAQKEAALMKAAKEAAQATTEA